MVGDDVVHSSGGVVFAAHFNQPTAVLRMQ